MKQLPLLVIGAGAAIMAASIYQETKKETTPDIKDPLSNGETTSENESGSSVGNIITWDSRPIYNTWYNWNNNIPHWNCGQWILYHKALEEQFKSTSKANVIWLNAWNHPDNSWAGCPSPIYCPNTYYCMDDCVNFVDYLASKKINVGGFFGQLQCDLQHVILNVTEGVRGASAAFTNILKIAPYAAIVLGYMYAKKQNLI